MEKISGVAVYYKSKHSVLTNVYTIRVSNLDDKDTTKSSSYYYFKCYIRIIYDANSNSDSKVRFELGTYQNDQTLAPYAVLYLDSVKQAEELKRAVTSKLMADRAFFRKSNAYVMISKLRDQMFGTVETDIEEEEK